MGRHYIGRDSPSAIADRLFTRERHPACSAARTTPLTGIAGRLPWRAGIEKRLAQRLAWSLAANALASLNALLSTFIAGHWLGPELFGRLALLLSAQTVVTTFIASSLGQVATKFTAELHDSNPERLRAISRLLRHIAQLISAILIIAGLLAPRSLNEALFGLDSSATLTRLAIPTVLFASLLALQQGHIAGRGAFRKLAKINVVRFVMSIALLAWLTPKYGLSGALVGLGASAAVAWMVGEFQLHGWWLPRATEVSLSAAFEETSVLTDFALPSWLSGALFAVAAWFGNFLISRSPNGLAQVGIFAAASQLGRSLLLFVPHALAPPFLVEMAAAIGRGDLHAVRSLFTRSLGLMVGIALIAACTVGLFGRVLLGAYGPSFVAGYPALLIVLTATLFSVSTLSMNTTLVALNRVWLVTALTGLWVVVFATAITVWHVHTAIGLAIAYMFGYAAQFLTEGPTALYTLRRRHGT